MGIHDIVGGALGLYRLVPINEAHIRIMFGKTDLFWSQTKRSYWVVPFVTKLHKLPLTNLRIDVPDIKLNDKDMAKFQCDIVCFVKINDPMMAAERTDITVLEGRYDSDSSYGAVAKDFTAIMESIGRTVATKQNILDIYKDRGKLDDAISNEVKTVFAEWGLRLVDLEIKDIKDAPGSTIIADIEKKIAVQITSDARVKIAEETKRAEIQEASNKKDAEMKKAENEEEWKQRQIQKDQKLAIAEREKEKQTATEQQKANEQVVKANRTLQIGNAEIDKERIETLAQADKSKKVLEAEANAQTISLKGKADAEAIQAVKTAEATGIDKLAEAQKKFNDAATQIEVIKANKDVQLAYAKAQEEAFKHATVNIVAGSTQELFSGGLMGKVNVGPKEGVAITQMLENLDPKTKETIGKMLVGAVGGKDGPKPTK